VALLLVNLPEPQVRFFAAPGRFAVAVSNSAEPSGTKQFYEVRLPPSFEERAAAVNPRRLRSGGRWLQTVEIANPVTGVGANPNVMRSGECRRETIRDRVGPRRVLT
jgi:hypothetical protein